MQSFASPPPTPLPHPPQSPTPPQKSRPTIHATPPKKGATIAHPHALSTKKHTERAQLSLIPTPFLPKNHRKGATIAYTYALSTKKSIERAQLSPMPQEKFVNICANSWIKTTNTGSTNHTDFLWNPCNNFNHKLAQIILHRILWKYDNICVTLLWHKICSINYATQFML